MHHDTWVLMQSHFLLILLKTRHHIIMSRPLGATHHCSNLHDYIYKVPTHYCIMTRPLGATLIEVFISNYKSQVAASMTTRYLGATYMEHSVFNSGWDEQHGFLQSGSNYMETSLKPSLCSPQDLGATGNMGVREKNLQILSTEQTRLTQCVQQLWPGVGNNYDSVPSIFTNR